jgi:hypothetical protein
MMKGKEAATSKNQQGRGKLLLPKQGKAMIQCLLVHVPYHCNNYN